MFSPTIVRAVAVVNRLGIEPRGTRRVPFGDDTPTFDIDLPEDSSSTEEDDYEMYRGAAHPLRSMIVRSLRGYGRLSTSDIPAIVDEEANDLDYHLRQLEKTALVRNQRDPRRGTDEPCSYYTLTPRGEIVLTEGLESGVQTLNAREH